MDAKTSQLQIRVSPAEKAALQRLARAAGTSVSAYVLGRALPAAGSRVANAVRRLSQPEVDPGAALEELAAALGALEGPELTDQVPEPDLELVPPLTLNRAAALVELAAHHGDVDPPEWTLAVEPLDHPHFIWSLASLRAYQMRVAPIPFKRRNVFFDPALGPESLVAGVTGPSGSTPGTSAHPSAADHSEAADPSSAARDSTGTDVSASTRPRRVPASARRARELFREMQRELAKSDVEVEFYFLGGALLFQAFAAAPGTANIDAMFREAAPVAEAIREVARRAEVSPSWPRAAAREIVAGRAVAGSAYLALPRVRVFEPVPEYVLALKCAAMRLGAAFREIEDVRFLLRLMDVVSVDAVLATVTGYLEERHLPPDVRTRLDRLLPS